MKKLLLLLLALLAVKTATSQAFIFNYGHTTSRSYYTRIPYTLEGGKPIVEVMINGKPRRFLFDTGGMFSIREELVEELNLRLNIPVEITDRNGKHKQLRVSILDSLTLGNVTFIETPVTIVEGSVILDGYDLDGLIGSNMLRNSVVQFSPSHITITNSKSKLELNRRFDSKLTVDLDHQSTPITYLKVGNRTIPVVFDTGAGWILSLSNKDFKRLKKTSYTHIATAVGSSSVGLFGEAEESELYRIQLNAANIGQNTLTNLRTTTSTGAASILGFPLTFYGRVTIDYVDRRFYFEPYINPSNVFQKQWSVSIIADDYGRLLVGAVWDEGLANVSAGDEIVAVDSLWLDNRTLYENLSTPILPLKSDSALLTVRKSADSTLRTVTIVKK